MKYLMKRKGCLFYSTRRISPHLERDNKESDYLTAAAGHICLALGIKVTRDCNRCLTRLLRIRSSIDILLK